MKVTVQRPIISRAQLLAYMMIFVIAPIITYVTGKRIDTLLSLPAFPPFPVNLLSGFTVFYIGLKMGIKSTKLLYRSGFGLPWGEAKKDVETSKLVVTGPYAYTRNPMILGYSLLPCGMGLMFRSIGMSTMPPFVVVLINVAIVKLKEESHLEERFGNQYLDYKRSTPFLIPKRGNITRLIVESIKSEPRGETANNSKAT
jgi:protein-S-isoprenylcysteine O-methyltransferase Ste14